MRKSTSANSQTPTAVLKIYQELCARKPLYKPEEQACWKRLVTNARMKPIYKTLELTEEGWRVFFDRAWNHVFLNHSSRNKAAVNAYEILRKISARAEDLAGLIDKLNDVLEDFGLSAEGENDPVIFDDTIRLLLKAGRTAFRDDIAPLLKKIPDSSRTRGMPTPSELLRTISETAAGLHYERNDKASRLNSGDPVLRAAGQSKNFSLHAAYYRTMFTVPDLPHEISCEVKKLSDQNIADFISVALDSEISAEAVKKLRQRKGTS